MATCPRWSNAAARLAVWCATLGACASAVFGCQVIAGLGDLETGSGRGGGAATAAGGATSASGGSDAGGSGGTGAVGVSAVSATGTGGSDRCEVSAQCGDLPQAANAVAMCCGTCLEQTCCGEAANCGISTACYAILQCVMTGGTPQDCKASQPDGGPEFDALANCAHNCDACPTFAGGDTCYSCAQGIQNGRVDANGYCASARPYFEALMGCICPGGTVIMGCGTDSTCNPFCLDPAGGPRIASCLECINTVNVCQGELNSCEQN